MFYQTRFQSTVSGLHLKAHANGRNIVDKQHAILLGPTCCARLHGTTTMLALVAYSLKPVKLLGPCKRTQHCWPKAPNNTQQCCDLLRPFAWAFTVTFSLEINLILTLFRQMPNCFHPPGFLISTPSHIPSAKSAVPIYRTTPNSL